MMIYGNGLNKKSLNKNKIIVYRRSPLSRFIGIVSFISATTFVIICVLFIFKEGFDINIFLFLIVMLVASIFFYFENFKYYICLDKKRKILIVHEYHGFKKEIIELSKVREIKFSHGKYYGSRFTIDILHVKQIRTWKEHDNLDFNNFKKRIEKFCKECNEYLAIYREEKANK